MNKTTKYTKAFLLFVCFVVPLEVSYE